MSGKR